MLVLTGLVDDYAHDGRTLVEELTKSALPAGVSGNAALFTALAAAYKQLNAPLGVFGLKTLQVSTTALSGDDATYAKLEAEIAAVTTKRDALAARIIQKLEAAEFQGQSLDPLSTVELIAQAGALLAQTAALGN
jgi:hypothetical protein